MADNVTSFRRFSALPANISAESGQTIEEIRLARGAPNKDPRAGPMAAPRRSRRALALTPSGSDDLRVSEPAEPSIDPYEGPSSIQTLLRGATAKLNHPLLASLKQVVDAMPEGDLRGNMQGSFQAIGGLDNLVGQLREMGEHIIVRMLTASGR